MKLASWIPIKKMLVLMILMTLPMASAQSSFSSVSEKFAACERASTAITNQQRAVFYISDCAQESQFDSHIAIYIKRIAKAPDAEKQSASRLALLAVKQLLGQIEQDNSKVNAPAVNAFRSALEIDSSEIANGSTNALILHRWGTGTRPGTVSKAMFFDNFNNLCLTKKPGDDPVCDREFTESFLPLLELYSVMSQKVVRAANAKTVTAAVQYYDDRYQKWTSYFADTGFQYPWELVFNTYRHGGFEEIAGGAVPPTSRHVLLHPAIGAFHNSSGLDGSESGGLAIFKWYGYKRWSYAGGNKATKVWGASIVSTFADIAGVDDAGLGVLLEYNQYGIGLTRHGSEEMIIFSIDAAKALANQPDSPEGWFEKIGL